MTQLILPAYKFLERLLTLGNDVDVEGPTTRRVESRPARSHMVRSHLCQAMISPWSVELGIHDLSMFRCYDAGSSWVNMNQLGQSQVLQPDGLLIICCQPQNVRWNEGQAASTARNMLLARNVLNPPSYIDLLFRPSFPNSIILISFLLLNQHRLLVLCIILAHHPTLHNLLYLPHLAILLLPLIHPPLIR